MSGEVITADVRVSQDMESLLITPRHVSEFHSLSRIMREYLPNLQVQRSAAGLAIPILSSDVLLSTEIPAQLIWSDEAKVSLENRRWAKSAHRKAYLEVNKIRSGGRSLAEIYLVGNEGLSVLDDHQLENVAAMTIPDSYGLCVFDEQGAGKTVTLIFAFDVLVAKDEVDFALIVAPKSMVPEWPEDFARFTHGLYTVEIVGGSRQAKRKSLRSGADVLVTNFETATSMEDELRSLLRHYGKRAILVVDESFYIKNLDAQRTRSLRHLREWCGRAFVLCGTPAPNAPHDLIQQFSIVDFGLTFSEIEVPDEVMEAQSVVQKAINQRGLFVRHLKAFVLPNLPGKSFERILVPMQPKQRKLYDSALEGLILDLRSIDNKAFARRIASFLQKRSALLQICSNPIAVSDGYTEVPAKLLALDELLEELVSRRQQKVVLWSFYTASLDTIFKRYRHLNPVRFDGSVKSVKERRNAIRKFQEDDETMLFVGNPAAAGAGITLHRAHIAIYESMSNQAAHYLQSLDRIHRRGQTHEVEYLTLLCEDTLEQIEYDRLIRKERSAQALLQDRVQEVISRESMLGEAIAARRMLNKV